MGLTRWSQWEELVRDGRSKGVVPYVETADTAAAATAAGPRHRDHNHVAHLPLFSIIGAQKGGTTYLRFLLVQHPMLVSGESIDGVANSEPHFFDWGWPLKGGRAPTVSEVAAKYSSHFVGKKRGSEAGPERFYFDTTPAYLVEGEVPHRAAKVMPDLKLIVVLRDPAERYRSELAMEVCRRSGSVPRLGFHRKGQLDAYLAAAQGPAGGTDADADADARLRSAPKPLRRGLYKDQLRVWLRHFKRDNLLVLKSEDLYADPQRAAAAALDWLGLPPHAFNTKAPKNPACGKSLDDYLGDGELERLRAWYAERNEGWEAV